MRRRNPSNYYMPLRDCPDLFAKFARLGDEAEIGQGVWLMWLQDYESLGVLPGKTGWYQRDETTDSFNSFVDEAMLVNRTLKLFEAATGPDGPNVEIIRDLLPDEYARHLGDEPEQIERAALQAVKDTIERKVRVDCYERLILLDTGAWREKRLSPFANRWECTFLLGAMWLQFKWLMSMDALRYCKAPDCTRHMSPVERALSVASGTIERQPVGIGPRYSRTAERGSLLGNLP